MIAVVEGAVLTWEDFGILRDTLTPAVDGVCWEGRFPGEEEVKANREKYPGRLARFLFLEADTFETGEVVFVVRILDPLSFVPSDSSSSAPEEGGVGESAREGALRGALTDDRTGEEVPELEAWARWGLGIVECQLVLDGFRA